MTTHTTLIFVSIKSTESTESQDLAKFHYFIELSFSNKLCLKTKKTDLKLSNSGTKMVWSAVVVSEMKTLESYLDSFY